MFKILRSRLVVVGEEGKPVDLEAMRCEKIMELKRINKLVKVIVNKAYLGGGKGGGANAGGGIAGICGGNGGCPIGGCGIPLQEKKKT